MFREAIRLQGDKALADEGAADMEVVAGDKSLIAARGPLWRQCDRQAGPIPKGRHGVDQLRTWGCSQHDGWVQSYRVEVVVTAAASSTVFPLVASADTTSVRKQKPAGKRWRRRRKTFTTSLPTAATTATSWRCKWSRTKWSKWRRTKRTAAEGVVSFARKTIAATRTVKSSGSWTAYEFLDTLT